MQVQDELSIIRPNELCELLSISKSSLYRKIEMGELPPKVQLGERSVGFYRKDIAKWLEERTETSREESG